MPGTVKSELLSDADRSHKYDSQEKVCWIRHLSLDKSHFITGEVEFKISFLVIEKTIKKVLTFRDFCHIIMDVSQRYKQNKRP